MCDRHDVEVLHEQRFVLPDDQTVTGGYRVVLCVGCGAAFSDTEITQQAYDELYARQSRYAAGPAAHATDSDRDSARFRAMAAEIGALVPERSARIVDVGCANGGMLAALKERGFTHLFGIDPSPGCVERTSAIPGVAARVGSLFDMPSDVGPFDVLVLSHVLEHVRDVKAALANIKRAMKPGAVLYVEVPDASRYADFAWSPFQDFNTEHINHFSLVTLANVLRVCGYRPLRSGAKEILSAPGMPYPAIYWFARNEDAAAAAEIKRDVTLGERLRVYTERSTALMRHIDRGLREALARDPRVIVWGTGELTAKLLADTALGAATITAFVDGNPVNQGRVLRGLRIQAPSDLTSSEQPIVVASILHHDAIARAIRTRGLRNPIFRLATGVVERAEA